MTTSNNGSNCGYNGGYGNGANWNEGTGTATTTSTCTEIACGTTYGVNEIPTPGAYVCNWNGSLLRVSTACFTNAGFTNFNFTSSDPLTVTYLTNDPTASVEDCRTWATDANVFCNF
jgi:hypothetical protein